MLDDSKVFTGGRVMIAQLEKKWPVLSNTAARVEIPLPGDASGEATDGAQ